MANDHALDFSVATPLQMAMKTVNSSMLQITMNSPLLDLYTCATLVNEADRLNALPNASQVEAKTLAEILVGSYPTRGVNDPAIYARAITSIFDEFSPEIAKEAINRLTRSLKFLPTRADVFEACANVKAQYGIAAAVGRVHLTEHARRGAVAKQDAERESEIVRQNLDDEKTYDLVPHVFKPRPDNERFCTECQFIDVADCHILPDEPKA